MYNSLKLKLLPFLLFILFFFSSPSTIFSAETIEIKTFPSSKIAGEEFEVFFTASALSPSSIYYMKGLGGNVGTTLTEVDTWNGGWVQQNGSWISMPVFTANPEGSASATIKIRYDPNIATNSKELKIRIRKTDGNDNYDSPAVSMSVAAATPAPSPTQTAVPTLTPKPTQTAAPTSKPIPTKTPTPKPVPTETPEVVITTEPNVEQNEEISIETSEPTQEPEVKGVSIEKKQNVLVYYFIISGILCLGYGGFLLYNMKHQNDQRRPNN